MRQKLAVALTAERQLSGRLERLINWVKPAGMKPAEVSLADIVLELRDLIADRLESSGVEFVTRFASDAPPAFGPPDGFRMAVLDLIVNAVTALDRIEVADHPKRITATLARCPVVPERVVLRIADTGPGMPADQLDVFKRFDNPLDPPPGGVGLGLYLAHRFVTGARGTIEFDSAPATGTIVILTLPTTAGANP